VVSLGVTLLATACAADAGNYVVVDTGQAVCYDAVGAEITCPQAGNPFYGQDAQHVGVSASYVISSDGLTVYDDNTGLTWQRTPDMDGDQDVDSDDKLVFADARDFPVVLNTQIYGGYSDWRLPTIKELYSLIDFRGQDPSGCQSPATCPDIVPFIDTDYFDFVYGDTAAGERMIDAQYWSSTEYVSTTMNGDATAFGVNFADGRIKGYPSEPVGPPGSEFTMTSFVRCVRGNPDYGTNDFVVNGDATVTDRATGLMWMQSDSGTGYTWEEALAYAESLSLAGHDDWRLPNAKELQSIVDYTRAPETTASAAINPVFDTTAMLDESGGTNYPFYWTSTTHAKWAGLVGDFGAYVAFGEALGWMEQPPGSGMYTLQDVHGAGAQRSDPKEGDPSAWPHGNGPQGDVVRIYNYVRCVRDAPEPAPPVPAASGWGLSVTAVLVLTAGTLVCVRRVHTAK
jgi:hypothetical protein